MGYRERSNTHPERLRGEQKHVHELQGSVKQAGSNPHEHRFCTVSCDAIPYDERDHVHEVIFRTDFHGDHYHEFCGKTGCAIPVGDRHVHYLESVTSTDDGHRHRFETATLIENPTDSGRKKKDYDCKEEPFRRNDYQKR